MRSFSPSMIRVATSTVSPTANCGISFFNELCSTASTILLTMVISCKSQTDYSNSKSQSWISNGSLLRASFLPQIRPPCLRPDLSLLHPPLGNRRMISAQQHLGHVHPSKLPRPSVLRILQQTIGKCLLDCTFLRAQCTRKQPHYGIYHNHRRQFATAEHVVADRQFQRL